MASRGLGTLTLDLVAKIAGFTGPIDKAARDFDKRMSAMEKRAYGFGKAIGTSLKAAAGVAAVAFGALTVAVSKAIDNADQLDEMSQKLQISTEQLSKWGYAAKLSGTDIDGLGRGIGLLSKNMAAAMDPKSRQANLFEALGIQIKDAVGNLRSVEQVIPEIADVFKTLDNATTESALSMQLFGKSGTELLEFLNRGSEGISALGDELSTLGGVISGETAAAAADFKDELDKLKEIGGGLALQLAAALLPAMKELVGDFRDAATNGIDVQRIAGEIAEAVRALAGAMKELGSVLSVFDRVGNVLMGIQAQSNAAGEWTNAMIRGNVEDMKKAAEAYSAASLQIDGAFAKAQTTAPRAAQGIDFTRGAPSDGAAASGDQARIKALQDRLNAALANPAGRTAKSGGGKSEAERDAERLLQSYERMVESGKERIALFGQEGEAAKVRYDTEFGALAALDPLKKAELVGMFERIDAMGQMAKLQQAADDAAKREVEAYDARMKSNEQLIEDMKFELSLLSMTNEQREKAIALSYLSADATDEQRAAVAALAVELKSANEAQEFWNDVQTDMSSAFYDFATGAKSAKDALGDFLDALYSSAVKAAADYFSETITNMMKSQSGSVSSGSGGGGGWGELFGAIAGWFGGGRAAGGNVAGGRMYEVGEADRPEILLSRGKQYMIPGNAGRVVPAGGGGVNQNFYTMGLETRRTAERKAQIAGREAQRALARNGR